MRIGRLTGVKIADQNIWERAWDRRTVPPVSRKQWYLIEAFDDLKYGYQIMKKLMKQQYNREALLYGTIAGYQSIQNTSNENAALLRAARQTTGRGHSAYSDASQHRASNYSLYGVGTTQNSGGDTRSNGTGDLSGSSLDSQGKNGSSVERKGAKGTRGQVV